MWLISDRVVCLFVCLLLELSLRYMELCVREQGRRKPGNEERLSGSGTVNVRERWTTTHENHHRRSSSSTSITHNTVIVCCLLVLPSFPSRHFFASGSEWFGIASNGSRDEVSTYCFFLMHLLFPYVNRFSLRWNEEPPPARQWLLRV